MPNLIDRERGRLGYFHGAGYYELEADDFAGLFRHGANRPEMLAPYVELVKLDAMKRLEGHELTGAALDLVRHHLARRPVTNPVLRFRKRLEQDIEWLRAEGLATFHQYAFATLRQFGSAAELTGSLCRWLAERGEQTAELGKEFFDLASHAKTAQFQLARVVSGRDIDISPILDTMERGWDESMQLLVEQYA